MTYGIAAVGLDEFVELLSGLLSVFGKETFGRLNVYVRDEAPDQRADRVALARRAENPHHHLVILWKKQNFDKSLPKYQKHDNSYPQSFNIFIILHSMLLLPMKRDFHKLRNPSGGRGRG